MTKPANKITGRTFDNLPTGPASKVTGRTTSLSTCEAVASLTGGDWVVRMMPTGQAYFACNLPGVSNVACTGSHWTGSTASDHFAVVASARVTVTTLAARLDRFARENVRHTDVVDVDAARRAAGHKRSAEKPNSAARRRIRASLATVCSLCLCPLDWSADAETHARGNIAHTVASEIGGTYVASNITGQCWTCNTDAKVQGRDDLSRDVDPSCILTRYLPQRLADARPDVRDVAPLVDGPTKADRRARRAARIGW